VITSSVVVNRPIEDVFEYAAQFDRHPEWQADLKSATFAGPAAVGATGTETRQMGPRAQSYDWRVSAYERPALLGFETLTGPMRPAGSMRFSAAAGGTCVEFEMALNPRGVMKLMRPVIERQVQRATDEHLQRFKEILEHP
jgi:uncharacterized membrane protein